MSLGVSTWDLLIQHQYKANCCWLVGKNYQNNLVPSSFFREQLQYVIHKLIKRPDLDVILINILSSASISTLVGETLAQYFTPPNNQNNKPPLPSPSIHFPQIIVRVYGGQLQRYKEHLLNLPIVWTEDIEEAINLISLPEISPISE